MCAFSSTRIFIPSGQVARQSYFLPCCTSVAFSNGVVHNNYMNKNHNVIGYNNLDNDKSNRLHLKTLGGEDKERREIEDKMCVKNI